MWHDLSYYAEFKQNNKKYLYKNKKLIFRQIAVLESAI